jgi:hypothetical protein
VRSDGFSKNITNCFPSSVRRKSEGRAFTTAARSNTDRTSVGLKSRVDTKSRIAGLLMPGTGATGVLSTTCPLILRSLLLVSAEKFQNGFDDLSPKTDAKLSRAK